MPSSRDNDAKYQVPNLSRALTILELLAEHPAGLTLADITRSLGFPKNSVFRVSMTLQQRGYLLRDDRTRRFTLSRKLLAMGYQMLCERPIVPTAIDVMRACRDIVKETVLIGTIVETHCIVLEQVLGTHPFKFSVDAGARLPLHVCAPGKAILAHLPERERDELVARLTLTRYNERTITSRRTLLSELQGAREAGFALDRGEQLHGIVCVAAPVFDPHGYPVASIWVTGPSDRVSEDMFPQTGNIIRHHAAMISSRLGYQS